MSNKSDLSTAHLTRLESLRNKHQQIQNQIDEGMKHPPTTDLETFIKSKKLEKLKLKEEITAIRGAG